MRYNCRQLKQHKISGFHRTLNIERRKMKTKRFSAIAEMIFIRFECCINERWKAIDTKIKMKTKRASILDNLWSAEVEIWQKSVFFFFFVQFESHFIVSFCFVSVPSAALKWIFITRLQIQIFFILFLWTLFSVRFSFHSSLFVRWFCRNNNNVWKIWNDWFFSRPFLNVFCLLNLFIVARSDDTTATQKPPKIRMSKFGNVWICKRKSCTFRQWENSSADD